MTRPDQTHQTEAHVATWEGAARVSLRLVMHVCPRLVRIRVGVYRVLFSSLILFLTSFVALFDVQIVGCQPGLAVVSKLEVSKLISGSINESLSLKTIDYLIY